MAWWCPDRIDDIIDALSSKKDKERDKKLDEILLIVQHIKQKQEEFMGQVFTDLDSLRQAIDAATNAVAQKIADLSSKTTNSMTDAEVAQIKADLQAEVDRLNALAA